LHDIGADEASAAHNQTVHGGLSCFVCQVQGTLKVPRTCFIRF
jgi:hypothetical protein